MIERRTGPESRLRRPGELAGEMRRELWGGLALGWRLFLRDATARYRRSFLGWGWVILPPLAATAVFLALQQTGLGSSRGEGGGYALWALVGSVLWQLFAAGVLAPIAAVSRGRDLLVRLRIPPEALVVAGVLETAVAFLLQLALLAFVLALSGRLPGSGILWLAPAAGGLLLLGTILGCLLVPLALLADDVSRALPALLALGLFLTPVGWSPEERLLWVDWNPVVPLLETARGALLGPPGTVAPDMASILVAAGFAGLAAWILLRLALPVVAERLPA